MYSEKTKIGIVVAANAYATWIAINEKKIGNDEDAGL